MVGSLPALHCPPTPFFPAVAGSPGWGIVAPSVVGREGQDLVEVLKKVLVAAPLEASDSSCHPDCGAASHHPFLPGKLLPPDPVR